MNRRPIADANRAYLVAIDEGFPVAERWSAVAIGLAIDEEREQPAAVPMNGWTDRVGVTVTTAGDGSFALVGRPWIACPPLRAASYTITATIEADGYLPAEVSIVVPTAQRTLIAPAPTLGGTTIALNSVAGLSPGQLLAIGPPNGEERARVHHLGPGPQQVTLTGGLGRPHAIGDHVVADSWTPVTLGAVHLRRPPVVVRGRTVRRDPITNAITAVPVASITLTDFWTTLSAVRASLPGSMSDPNPLTRAFVVALSPGLVSPRDVGPAQVSRQDLVPVVADERFLTAAAAPGTQTIGVTDRQALAAGTVVQLDPDDREKAESVTVTVVSGLGPINQRGELTLALPLSTPHRERARIRRVLPQPPAPAVAFRRDARPGDRTLFVADVTTLPDDIDVRISGGVPAAERQHVDRFEATSDANGYFALPPVHRVAALQLHATAPLLTPVDITFHPQYGPLENWLDIVFA